MSMIRFSHVFKRYSNGFDALRGVSLNVEPGEMVFLIGHSGAGKSTFLKLITRAERTSRGEIEVNGQNLNTMRARRIAYHRRAIGTVFQDYKLLANRTVFDNVALPLVVSGAKRRDIERRVRAALDKVALLGKEPLLPIMLSGGEQQRVSIARAVVNRPSLLLADEPTGNLDAALAGEIMDLFVQLNRHQVTVVIATHDMRHVRRVAARVLELRQGRLVGDAAACR